MKYIEKFEKIVACLSVSVMAILVFINVIARFVFNSPLAVADEMSCYLFVLMSFMGTAIAARRKAHLGLTLLTDKLSPNAARIVQTVMYAIATLFCLLIVIFGIEMVISQYQIGQAGMDLRIICTVRWSILNGCISGWNDQNSKGGQLNGRCNIVRSICSAADLWSSHCSMSGNVKCSSNAGSGSRKTDRSSYECTASYLFCFKQ